MLTNAHIPTSCESATAPGSDSLGAENGRGAALMLTNAHIPTSCESATAPGSDSLGAENG